MKFATIASVATLALSSAALASVAGAMPQDAMSNNMASHNMAGHNMSAPMNGTDPMTSNTTTPDNGMTPPPGR